MTQTHLERANALERPAREAMLRRDPTVQQFWIENRDLLSQAWGEWDASNTDRSSTLNGSLLDPNLHNAVARAWEHPMREAGVRDLLQEVAPGVFSVQFFDPDRLIHLRGYLEAAWDAGIPLRPPYGIVLNRGGAMLDPRSEGCLGAPSFQAFYRTLLDTYMRPISRLLFPEVLGYDSQTFGFSINYQPGMDTSIRPHSDASAVTLNINANLPDEDFAGSTVDFFDPATEAVRSLRFTPGMAMIHRGRELHAAQPITAGSRTNLVLWLFGDGGRVPGPGVEALDATPAERWTIPAAVPDHYAPF